MATQRVHNAFVVKCRTTFATSDNAMMQRHITTLNTKASQLHQNREGIFSVRKGDAQYFSNDKFP